MLAFYINFCTNSRSYYVGLSHNWNVTGMHDKLLVEGILQHAMSVKCSICSQQLKGCTESKPEDDFGFMYGCMFPQGLQLLYTLGQILRRWRKLLSGSKSGTVRKFINSLVPGALSVDFLPRLFQKHIPNFSQEDLAVSSAFFIVLGSMLGVLWNRTASRPKFQAQSPFQPRFLLVQGSSS